MITVFYDGKCGLCLREIEYYRTIAAPGLFHWRDVTDSAADLEQAGISLVQGLKLLHAVDHDGTMHVGVDAFILIWSQLRYWRLPARLLSLPLLRQVANAAYAAFAHWRFGQLEHCRLAAERETAS